MRHGRGGSEVHIKFKGLHWTNPGSADGSSVAGSKINISTGSVSGTWGQCTTELEVTDERANATSERSSGNKNVICD